MSQRTAFHWFGHSPILALAVGFGLTMALVRRPPSPATPQTTVEPQVMSAGFGIVRRNLAKLIYVAVAVFRDGTQIGALSNLCAHQNGPVGEGRIIDGYVTCPWHGHQYRLADGCAPRPFVDKLVTCRVRIGAGVVEANPGPLPPRTPAGISFG